MNTEKAPPTASVDAVVIRADGCEQYLHRPQRGILMLPNGIVIDFGTGVTRLSREAITIVDKAAKMLSRLQRASG